MERRVTVRPLADRDLDEQAAYLAEHGSLDLALKFYRAASKTFRLLASQPEMGSAARYRSPALMGMRMFPIKGFSKYLAFYRPLADRVEIVRVLHAARDLETLFESVPPGS